MRKVTKGAEHCDKCGSQLVGETQEWFCDKCKQKIKDKLKYKLTVFWKNDFNGNHTTSLDFCSLNCTRQWLLNFPYNIERIEFISLPFIHNGLEINEFLVGMST